MLVTRRYRKFIILTWVVETGTHADPASVHLQNRKQAGP
jgi:hypothetical protein